MTIMGLVCGHELSRIEEERVSRGVECRRAVCLDCRAPGPWWTVIQINGPFGRDIFVFEGSTDIVIRWGEMQESEARIPMWVLEKLKTSAP